MIWSRNIDRNDEWELSRISRHFSKDLFILAGSDGRSNCQSRNLRIGRETGVTSEVIAGFPDLPTSVRFE